MTLKDGETVFLLKEYMPSLESQVHSIHINYETAAKRRDELNNSIYSDRNDCGFVVVSMDVEP